MKKILLSLLIAAFSVGILSAQNSVTIEAETGTLGADFSSLSSAGVNYITCATDLIVSQNPGSTNRVASYTVSFPAAGTYELYARFRVGPAGANDDSYFYGNGFSSKTVASSGTASDNDWITANQLSTIGDTTSNTIVSGGGSIATNQVWKWLNMSQFNGGEPPVSFVITAGNLTQTLQIGARENGLDIDKFVFGLAGYFYTVKNLNNGEPGSTNAPPPPFVPSGPPIAAGNGKFLGSAYSFPQKTNFLAYWNQVTPENGGKWGSVEATRNVMNWNDLDEAYRVAKDNNLPFKLHTLIWGSQQPAWIETLSPAEQLLEIKEWFSLTAARYPAIDIIEVVNEPLHAAPNHTGNGGGNYINALGGTGATGYDWILNSFRLARQYFPTAKLWINDYSIINSTASTAQYLQIINLLKLENLVDGIGEQGHAFTTFSTSSAVLTANLNTLATSGLPLFITELDIDGPPAETPQGDAIQLNEYKRVFPLFWEHEAIKGITVWGFRPGHWRTVQGAPLVYSNGAEKEAMVWLKQYVQNSTLPVMLTSYEAVKYNNQVALHWAIAAEVNSGHFEVERSNDGKNYATIISVKTSVQNAFIYTVYDEHPLAGKNYYRLVQYDKDGQKTYYGVRIVEVDEPGLYVKVYPNPVTSSFTIRSNADFIEKRTILITDLSGRVVKSFTLPATGVQTINASGMSNGSYWVRLITAASSVTNKIIISK